MDKQIQENVVRENEYILKFLGLGLHIEGMYYETWSPGKKSSAEIILSNCDSSGTFDASKYFPECKQNFPEREEDLIGKISDVAYAIYSPEGYGPFTFPPRITRIREYKTNAITYEEFLRLGSPKELVKKVTIGTKPL